MRHRFNQELFHYWEQLRDARPAPFRKDIEAAAISHMLSSVFMVKMIGDIATLHMVGGDVSGLFGVELRGKVFGTMWLNGVARKPSHLARRCAVDQELFLIDADGLSPLGKVYQLEMIMLPLCDPNPNEKHLIGALCPLPRNEPLPYPHIIGMSVTHIRPIDRGTLVVSFSKNHSPAGPQEYDDKLPASRKVKHLSVIDGGINKAH